MDKNQKIIFFFAFLLFILLIIINFQYAWDDCAITLGFSKNLAKFGLFAPSEFSETVEGYSSTLWMLLNSIFFTLKLNSFQVFMLAKILTLFINLINLFLFYKILILIKSKQNISDNEFDQKHTSYFIFFSLLIFLFSRSFIFESLNAMETPLYLTFVLSIFYIYNKENKNLKDNIFFIISGIGLILIRFEGIWFLIPFLIMDAKKFGLKVFRIKYYYLWLIFWLFTIALRYYIFGELLTNPIIAKSSPIFKTEPFLSNHLNPFLSILKTYSPFIILSIYLIIKEKRFAINLKFFDTSTLLIICGIIFNLIIGNNFGPPDRMFYPVIPFIIIFIYSSLGSNFLKITKNRIILGLIFIIFVSYNIYSVQTKQAISVMKVKEINEGIEQIQKLSAKQKITYAGPDMGGIMLFGNNLRIIDIAGLCNKFIAKNGYKDFDKYIFDIEKPDIIEIHEGWTSLSGIKNSERLYLNYSLYIFKGFALFIKNEIIQSLINKNLVDSLMYIPQSDISNADSVILNKFQKYKILKY